MKSLFDDIGVGLSIRASILGPNVLFLTVNYGFRVTTVVNVEL